MEYKFRVWDKENKEWDKFPIKYTCIEEIGCEDNYEWCQYTGLRDKNGKEIYEGDIIQTKDFYECGELIFKGKKIVVESLDYYLNTNLFIDTSGEIIGNIYEHKELLEDEKMNYLK